MLFKHRKHDKPSLAAPESLSPSWGADLAGAERVTFAAGCFWGVEAAFRAVEGVLQTSVGYTGGRTVSPTYEQVCSHRTGHAEAVDVCFDPAIVSYGDLLEVFWRIHDPTSLNRQGLDVGDQYRSAIFFHTPEQALAAARSRMSEQEHKRRPIVTEIAPAPIFYRAEEYHQRYFERSGQAACAATLQPAA